MNPRNRNRNAFVLCLLCFFAALPFALSQDVPAETIRLNNVGVAYLTQARVDEALDSFRQALRRNPALPAARLNEGIALIQAHAQQDERQRHRQSPHHTRAPRG